MGAASSISLARALKISVDMPPVLQKGELNGAGKSGRDGKLIEILLVENDVNEVVQALKALKNVPFPNRVHVVSDGALALAYLACRGKYLRRFPDGSPDVVLLDLDLPNVSGMEVLRCIKGDRRTAGTIIVVLAGDGDEHYLAECQRLGADNYALKPVDFQQLCEAISKSNFNGMPMSDEGIGQGGQIRPSLRAHDSLG